jgi:hypothetical protein
MTSKNQISRKKIEKLLEEAQKLLEKQGYEIMVIGGVRIEQRDLNKKFKYELVIDFVGKKRGINE